MQRRAVLLTVFFLILAGGISSAQSSDISVNGNVAIANTSTGHGVHETATKSAGLLLSFRHFSSHSGFEVNYGYTKSSQKYTDQSGASIANVQSGNHEITGAYIFRLTRGPIQPFALAGGGLLIFNPTSSAIDNADPSISRQNRPVFLYGLGADVRVTNGVAVRAQYRSLIYEGPDFFGANLAIHTSSAMQTAEPTIGLVYKF